MLKKKNYILSYFPRKYFLSLVPSVRIFLLLTIDITMYTVHDNKYITCPFVLFQKHPSIDPFSFNMVIIKCFKINNWLIISA